MRTLVFRLIGIVFSVLLIAAMLIPVAPAAEAAEFEYAYSKLTSVQQYTYDRIVECVENRKDSYDLDESKGVLVGDLEAAMDAVLLDHPELFWFVGIHSYSSMQASGIVLSFTTSYELNGVKIDGQSLELATAIASFKSACNEILGDMPLWATSDYEKALYLHDALAARVTYTGSANAHNAYGALVEGKAVCDGYAEAYQYLLNQKGISASKVVGKGLTSNGQEAHAWNIVWIGGKCVYTDVTWDDQGHSLFHSYFNRSLAAFSKDHIPENQLPACDHDELDYFTVETGDIAGVGILSSQTTPEDFGKLFQPFTAADGRQQLVCQVRCDNTTVDQWLKDHNTDFVRLTGASLESYSMTTCGDESQIVLNCRDTTVPVTGITLTTGEIHLNQIGAARQIGFKILPGNATNQKLTFRSSNPLVAVVDASGIVRAISTGTAEITVTTDDGGFSVICKVTVDMDHVHDEPLRQVAASAADCTNAGNEAYYVCDSCDSWFYDSEAEDMITDHESVILPASGHRDSDGDGLCDVCGSGEGESAPTEPSTQPEDDPTEPESMPPATQGTSPEPTVDTTQPTQTLPQEEPGQAAKPQGDLTVLYIVAGAILAAGVVLTVILRKRS